MKTRPPTDEERAMLTAIIGTRKREQQDRLAGVILILWLFFGCIAAGALYWLTQLLQQIPH